MFSILSQILSLKSLAVAGGDNGAHNLSTKMGYPKFALNVLQGMHLRSVSRGRCVHFSQASQKMD